MSDTSLLQQKLLQLDPAYAEGWPHFEPLLHEVSFEAGAYLAAAGRIANAIYFISAGIVRVFAKQQDKEYSLDFAFPGMFSTAYTSFILQSPSEVNLQAITPVSGLAFYYDDLQQLYRAHHGAEKMGRLIAEQQYLRKYRRELSFLQHTAQERYLQLLEQHPEVVQHIPVKHIASYLGIEPESLSRIRKQLRR
ncbi:Crp/Fnr family transcriptional regulator [Chitinophaga japonensis]|uniref:CRP-like cAMP-binding protein n=1 Tax=Chitinophaga japonensis TaxID=104662 RepID=A0A562T559_CHIJA|nr:Crp/Fnr family transcriptional regulator [Chitinophaga japonensis]TWI88665.1 CRP-like cAMP-binding protein [Chitinophaga japonensis]